MSENKVTYGEQLSIGLNKTSNDCSQDVQGFNCGDPAFNEWIADDAANPGCVSLCFTNQENGELIAYASIACSSVQVSVPGGFLNSRPAVEVRLFAVSADYQHMPFFDDPSHPEYTLSVFLFFYLLTYITELAESKVGAELVVLNSVPRAYTFYKNKIGFADLEEDMQIAPSLQTDGCKSMYRFI